jgi:hypothetical protein
MNRINQLWKREQRNGFSGTLKSSIVTAFLGKTKTLVPKARAEARKEALGKEDITNNSDKDVKRPSAGRESRGGKTFKAEEFKNTTSRAIFDA